MGRLFGWLDRGYVETIEEYDKRMNQLPEIHAGYVFFDWINYHGYVQSFSVFIEWNGELNHKLQDAMPQGGYCFRCTTEEAASLIDDHNGIPVYVKLYAKCGRLYVRQLYFNCKDKQYEIHFNGCEVIPPDMVCFIGLQNDNTQQGALSLLESKEENNKDESSKRWWIGSGRALGGSYRKRSGSYIKYRGSFRMFGSSFRGSYRGQLGSYRGNVSSYRNFQGSYRGLIGSYRGNTSSYRNFQGSYGGYFGLSGSYRGLLGSFRSLLGSYRNLGVGYGSYWGLGGSYRGSYRNLSGSYHGSFRGLNGSYFEGFYHNMINGPEPFAEDSMEENQMDGALGYGLDLI